MNFRNKNRNNMKSPDYQNLTSCIMKKTILILFFLVGGLFLIQSCSSEDPIYGNLDITVYNRTTGALVTNEQIFLATSLSNLQQGIYLGSGWTGTTGNVFFRDLTPGYYYYGAEHWNDCGAIKVMAGDDFFVNFYVISPKAMKK
jgi:hypothetical protein